MAIVTYNDNGTIKVVKSGNYVVSTDADPVIQKEWVFMNPALDPAGLTTYQQNGTQDPAYASQGCASPATLGTYLNSQANPNGLFAGTKVAVRMNHTGGNCDTWAIFEVYEV